MQHTHTRSLLWLEHVERCAWMNIQNLITYWTLVLSTYLRCQRRSSDKDVYWWSLVTLIAISGGACVTAMSLRVDSRANDKDVVYDMLMRWTATTGLLWYLLLTGSTTIQNICEKIIIFVLHFLYSWGSCNCTHRLFSQLCTKVELNINKSTDHYSYYWIFEKLFNL